MDFGRYEIKKELGRGSMGIVYQAYDPRLDRWVALKVLKTDLVTNEVFVQRFLKEARAVARLTHPNIVSIYDVDEDQGTIYIAMELLAGESLDKLIGKTAISENQIVHFGIQMAETLDYAHRRGIIHRDIKPGNIILDHNGRIKITDFGVARIEDPTAPQQTLAGEVLGTPAYMSPEQAMGQRVNGCADIFSLGVILYELSTGARPFKGETLSAILMAIIHNTPPEPKTINASISPTLAWIIMRCLSKKADERFQTGRDLAEALKRLVQQEEAAASAMPSGKKPSRRLSILVLTLLLVLGLGGLFFSQFLSRRNKTTVQEQIKSTSAAKPETTSVFDEAKRKIEELEKSNAEMRRRQDNADKMAEEYREAREKSPDVKQGVIHVAVSEKAGEARPQEQTAAKEASEKKPQLNGKPAVVQPTAESLPPVKEHMKTETASSPEKASDLDRATRKIEELEKRIAETRRKQEEADKTARELQETLRKLPEKKSDMRQEVTPVTGSEKVKEVKTLEPATKKEVLEKKTKEPEQEAIKNPQGTAVTEGKFPFPETSWSYRVVSGGDTWDESVAVLEDGVFEKRKVHRAQMKVHRKQMKTNVMKLFDIASGNWIADIKGGEIVNMADPHNEVLSFPLFVGQKRQPGFSFTHQGKTNYMFADVEVKSFEKVAVPAGTFEAFMIQAEFKKMKRIYWYSPQLKIFVKIVEERGLDESTRELTEYKAP